MDGKKISYQARGNAALEVFTFKPLGVRNQAQGPNYIIWRDTW